MTGPARSALLVAPLLAAGLLCAMFPSARAGEVYRWKDAKGVTHFSDAPPPKGTYQAKLVRPDAAPAPAAPARVATAAAPPGASAAATTVAATDTAAIAKANCTAATTNLERLKSGGPIGLDANGDGKPDSVLSAEEVAKQTEVAQGQVGTYCGAATPQP